MTKEELLDRVNGIITLTIPDVEATKDMIESAKELSEEGKIVLQYVEDKGVYILNKLV